MRRFVALFTSAVLAAGLTVGVVSPTLADPLPAGDEPTATDAVGIAADGAETEVPTSSLGVTPIDRCGTANDSYTVEVVEGAVASELVDGRIRFTAADGYVLVDGNGDPVAEFDIPVALTDEPCATNGVVTADFIPMCNADGTNSAGAMVVNGTADTVSVALEFHGGRPHAGPFEVAAGETFRSTLGLAEDSASEAMILVDGELLVTADLTADCADGLVPTHVAPRCVDDQTLVDVNVVNLTDAALDVAVDFGGEGGSSRASTLAAWDLDGEDTDLEIVDEPLTAGANLITVRVDYDRDGRYDETVYSQETPLDCGQPTADSVGAYFLDALCDDGQNLTWLTFTNVNPFPVSGFELTYGDTVEMIEVPAQSSVDVELTLPEDETTTVTVTFPDGADGFLTLVSEDVTVDCVENLPPLTATPLPTISGTLTVGSTLTANAGTWAPSPVTLAYQWFRGESAISGATARTYKVVSADAGQPVSVKVTGSKTGYEPATTASAAKTIAKLTLTATPVPKITGTGAVGKTLAATAGTWSPSPVTVAYQWYRGAAPIADATAATYKLVAADAGQSVTVKVTGTKTGYTTVTKTSTALAVAKMLTATPIPTISGSPDVGKTFTAVRGTWGPGTVTLKYQWYRSGAAISGATASTYKLVSTDAGKAVTVKVTGSRTGYTSIGMTSAPITINRPLTSKVPTISGTGAVGKTLTAATGTWGPSPVTLAYQWYRSGAAIAGATASTYLLTAADAGKSITVKVTGSKAGYTTAAKTSAAKTVAKLLTATPVPKISGTGAAGQTLTAIVGTWGPGTVTLKYQWYRDGAAISGATAKSYKLVSADASTSITVTVTGSKSGYTSVSMVSAPKAVAPPNPGSATNCDDFATWSEAQAWFDKYYPFYGDVAGLDGSDEDGIACEGLAGAPTE